MRFSIYALSFFFLAFVFSLPVHKPIDLELLVRENGLDNAIEIPYELEKRENTVLTTFLTQLNQSGTGVRFVKYFATSSLTQGTTVSAIAGFLKAQDLTELLTSLDRSNLAIGIINTVLSDSNVFSGLIRVGTNLWSLGIISLKKRAPEPSLFGNIIGGVGNLLGIGGNSSPAPAPAPAQPTPNPAVNQATAVVGGAVNQATAVVGGAVNQATAVVGGAANQATAVVGGAANQATAVVGGAANQATAVVGGAVGQANSVIGVANGQASSVVNVIGNQVNSVGGAADSATTLVTRPSPSLAATQPAARPASGGLFGGILNGIGNIVGGVVGGVVDGVGNVVDGVGNVVGGVVDGVGNVVGGVGNIVGDVFDAGFNVIDALTGINIPAGIQAAELTIFAKLLTLARQGTVEDFMVSLQKSGLASSVVRDVLTDPEYDPFIERLAQSIKDNNIWTWAQVWNSLLSSGFLFSTITKLFTSYLGLIINLIRFLIQNIFKFF